MNIDLDLSVPYATQGLNKQQQVNEISNPDAFSIAKQIKYSWQKNLIS